MNWQKQGLIFEPDLSAPWIEHSALQPTPIILGDTIRVYAGFRDQMGVSRVGYVDLDGCNPSNVVAVSEEPVLDIGKPGSFDDNGVVPAAVAKRGDKLYLYYAGYQRERKVRFSVFGGLAISRDGGTSFERYQEVPVLERCDDSLLFRVIHSIMYEDGVWKTWYCGGSKFIQGEDKTLPVYNIRYQESENGLDFDDKGEIVFETEEDEFRHGRPYVFKDGKYKMLYATATKTHGYRLGYAESENGREWTRKDEEVGIDVSDNGWDSEMMSYPSVVHYDGQTYLFYNGNNMGKSGFGYAILEGE